MPTSSSCSFEVEKATPKTSAFKEELVVEWESEKKGKNDKEEYEENNTKSRFKDVVPRVRAFESGNDIREWDKAWAPLLVTSSSSFIPAAIQGESTISTKNRVANEEEEEDLPGGNRKRKRRRNRRPKHPPNLQRSVQRRTDQKIVLL